MPESKMSPAQVQASIQKTTKDFKSVVEKHENEINTYKNDILTNLQPKFDQAKKGTPARKMFGQQIRKRLDHIKLLEKFNAVLEANIDKLQTIKKAQDLLAMQQKMNDLLKGIKQSFPEAPKQASVVVPLPVKEKTLQKEAVKEKGTEEDKHPLVEAYNNSEHGKQYGPAVPHTLPNGIKGMKLQFPNQEAAEKFFTEQAEKGHQFKVFDLNGNMTYKAEGGKLEKVSSPAMRSQADSVPKKLPQADVKQYDKDTQARTAPGQAPTPEPEEPKFRG